MSSTRQRELTSANVNFDDPEEWAEFLKQQVARSSERAQQAVRHLQEQGILDANGNRIRKDTPPDMRDESKTDFGG